MNTSLSFIFNYISKHRRLCQKEGAVWWTCLSRGGGGGRGVATDRLLDGGYVIRSVPNVTVTSRLPTRLRSAVTLFDVWCFTSSVWHAGTDCSTTACCMSSSLPTLPHPHPNRSRRVPIAELNLCRKPLRGRIINLAATPSRHGRRYPLDHEGMARHQKRPAKRRPYSQD